MNSKTILIFLSFYLLISAIIYAVSSNNILLSSVYYLPILTTIVFGFSLIAKTGIQKGFGQNMLFLLLGFILWMIAETIYLYYFYVTKTDPYPSIADLFFILGYPLILTGMIKEALDKKLDFKSAFTPRSLALIAVLIIMTTFTLVQVVFSQSASYLEKFVSVFYCLGDFIIIICLLILVKLITSIQKGLFANPWKIFIVGALFMIVADNLYSIFAEPYENGVLLFQYIDMPYIASYFLFAFTFLSFGSMLKRLKNKALTLMQQKAA